MDILFVSTTEKLKLNYLSNGTMLLGTKLLEAGFSVDIVRFGQFSSYMNDYELFISEITDHILAINPKAVSFYTLWPYYHISIRIANEIKRVKPEMIVVFGGPQSSATAEESLKTFASVDYICTGEGENTVVPFFTEILHNQASNLSSIPGLCYRRGDDIIKNTQEIELCNLDELPHWDDRLITSWNPYEEEDIHASNYYMPIDAGRGCPYSCTFCSTSNFWRRTYRLKSAQTIINDIKYYHNKYGITSFWFSHDAFTSNKKLVAEVCDRILAENLKITWRCSTRIDCLTEDLVHKMVQAGLRSITVGVETGSPRMQKIINKRLNLDYAKKMIGVLQENNLSVGLFFMYGFPEETEEDLNQTLDMLFNFADQGVHQVNLELCHFSPATQMTIDHMDELVFDPDFKVNFRNLFGYPEEKEILCSNKSISSTFYNLETPLRDKYQNLFYFNQIYQRFNSSLRFLRRYYRGDNLAFYAPFAKHVAALLGRGRITSKIIKECILNSINDMDISFAKQIKSIAVFECDLKEIKKSKTDCSVQKVYDFSYLDYLEKIPIEEFSEYKTELIIQKTGNNISIQMLDITPFDEA